MAGDTLVEGSLHQPAHIQWSQGTFQGGFLLEAINLYHKTLGRVYQALAGRQKTCPQAGFIWSA